MNMEFEFFISNRKKNIDVKICKSSLSKFKGLMFEKQSRPLLLVFNKEKTISIHSFFCKPFTAIWLDKNRKPTKMQNIKNWGLKFSGRGKYLLEIPKIFSNAPILGDAQKQQKS